MKNKKMTIKVFFELCDITIKDIEEQIAKLPPDKDYQDAIEATGYCVLKKWIEEYKNQ